MKNQQWVRETIRKSLGKRYISEKLFRCFGGLCVFTGLALVSLIFSTLIYHGKSAFTQAYISLTIELPENQKQYILGSLQKKSRKELSKLSHTLAQSLYESLYVLFPEVQGRKDRKKLRKLLSTRAAYDLLQFLKKNPQSIEQENFTFSALADDELDQYFKGRLIVRPNSTNSRRFAAQQVSWAKKLAEDGRLFSKFNTIFFTHGDSKEPEQAGILGALVGSLLTLFIAFIISFPLGVATTIYLHELAPPSKWVDMVNVSINNLAAVPSIIFGLLGLAILIGVFDMPRSASLVGGLVLALMTLPTIIITSRSALQTVPATIKEASFSMGASRIQTVLHHSLPMSLPGIMTGSIIGMAQALGESAPLLMIGMVAFIADIPDSFTAPATALPVQIYLWADSPERAFAERTAGAILVLLLFLVIMNLFAVIVRKIFEKRVSGL